jgi:hypothetical protein
MEMLTDTLYELAIRELSDLPDPVKEMLDEEAKVTPAALEAAESDPADEWPVAVRVPCCQS